MTAASKRLVWVDALRGLAALVVLVHHVQVYFDGALRAGLGVPAAAVLQAIGDRNAEAVLLFFVLSGFSIRLSVEGRGLGTRADVNHYLYRRFRRILPLYWLALAVSALGAWLAPVDDASFTSLALLGNLCFLQSSAAVAGSWFPPFARNGPLWSLAFEMFYYLSFPLFYARVRGRDRRLWLALALSLAGVGCNRVLPNPFAQFLSQFLVWYLGVELAERYLQPRQDGPSEWLYAPLALIMLAGHLALGSQSLRLLATGLLFTQLGCLALRLAPRASSAPSPGVARAFAWVGTFSYALYLLHYPVLRALAVRAGQPAVVVVGAAIAACLLASFVAESLLTRPRYAFLDRAYLPVPHAVRGAPGA